MILVYNAKSGGAFSADALRASFKRHKIPLEALISIENLEELEHYLKDNVTVAAVGGDGTISAVAAMLAGTRSVLAPLPGGTLNHFTKDLGIPQDLDEALAALADASVRKIDVARVNNCVFINNSSLGMYPTSLRTRERYEQHIGKWPAALFAVLRSLVKFRTYKMTLGSETFRTPFIFVGNNDYEIDTVGTATRRALNKGHLCVFIAKTASRWTLLKIFLWTLVGKAKELDEFEVRKVSSFTLHAARRRLHVAYDGEVKHMPPPLRYEIMSKALSVLG